MRQKIVLDSSRPSVGDAMRRVIQMTKRLFCFQSLGADGAESIEGLGEPTGRASVPASSPVTAPPDMLVIEREPA
ncbi:hypothetical protein ACQPZQ_23875 [Pseudonocardia sp. CA-142604]|uniref:hypothetical protein n=1 Tax=Pseudonocardia sp. CA-142604 TaxID=3240024 RepID=UPI003D8C1E52